MRFYSSRYLARYRRDFSRLKQWVWASRVQGLRSRWPNSEGGWLKSCAVIVIIHCNICRRNIGNMFGLTTLWRAVLLVGLVAAFYDTTVSTTHRLNVPRVLLPVFNNFAVNFTLEVTDGGCYKWWLYHFFFSFLPTTNYKSRRRWLPIARSCVKLSISFLEHDLSIT